MLYFTAIFCELYSQIESFALHFIIIIFYSNDSIFHFEF